MGRDMIVLASKGPAGHSGFEHFWDGPSDITKAYGSLTTSAAKL
jgi:hypothetical protein